MQSLVILCLQSATAAFCTDSSLNANMTYWGFQLDSSSNWTYRNAIPVIFLSPNICKWSFPGQAPTAEEVVMRKDYDATNDLQRQQFSEGTFFTNMDYMFSGCYDFNCGRAPGVGPYPLIDEYTVLTDSPDPSYGMQTWSNSVTDISSLQSTFYDCSGFNDHLTFWRFKRLKNLESCFRGCKSFNNGYSPGTSNNPGPFT